MHIVLSLDLLETVQRVERMIGILAVKTRSLLGTMEVPSKYWPLAMITAAAATGQVVLQADFPNAYLNADMTENIYVCQPYGIHHSEDRHKVCLIKKALYGCPISGKRWHDAIASKI